MYSSLKHLRVIEGASFIAAPSCGLYLSQMGADVIRFDDPKRGPDLRRWPLSKSGSSFYWEGLNKGKRSIAVDLVRPQGREIAANLITAGGAGAGLFLTNYPAGGFLSHDKLATKRPDLITLRVMGWGGGRQAVDYTVNSTVGIPFMTGPARLSNEPVNHVLPAWDLLAGAYGAFAMISAFVERELSGIGRELKLPLGDVALSALGNLGQIAEVIEAGADRPRMGNELFGAIGRDFETADKRRLMIVAITARQWSALIKTLYIEREISDSERNLSVSFEADEGIRFQHRITLYPIIELAVRRRNYQELTSSFDAAGVCWGPYQPLSDVVSGGIVEATPELFQTIMHPSGCVYPAPGAAVTFAKKRREAIRPAPQIGQHTEEILADVMGYSEGQIAKLVDGGVVHCAQSKQTC
jgi:2-methylfumaryl-CoA isomerase